MGGASRLIMLLTAPFPSFLHRPSSVIFLRRLFITTGPRHLTLSYPSSSSQHQHQHQPQLHTQPRIETTNISSNNNGPTHHHHPWPEWSNLITRIFSQTQEEFILPTTPEDAFITYEEQQNELPHEFIRCASTCLAFSRSHPHLLRLLSRKDIEIIVSNGTPFLFKTALETTQRMRAFLGTDGTNVLESEKANTVDVMKYILSYASNPSGSSAHGSLYSRELVESSVRNLLRQMTEMSFPSSALNLPPSDQYQFSEEYDQSLRPVRQNVTMKRGDWICPKCSFMNFARNVECLECEEPRPKRQLTGGEWECPQCNFFNYGRNLTCLRCDCKGPGEVVANKINSMSKLGYIGNYVNKANVDRRLVENDEKENRWFAKVSQLDNASGVSSTAADEDFPDNMPLRKGENRFVVSTRKTPLERRLVNSQNQRKLGNYGTSEGSASQSEDANKNLDLTIRKSLDQIFGGSSAVSRTDVQDIAVEQKLQNLSIFPRSGTSEFQQPEKSNSNQVPFVPLQADMFSKQNQDMKTENGEDALEENSSVTLSSVSEISTDLADFAGNPLVTESDEKVKEQDEKSERWFQRVAELHNVKDLPSAISDDDFPEIMPMRRGENRFVVNKKKDRSLTSPAYKRQVAMVQGSNSNFVPFVPFPPGYFARKDSREPDGEHSESSKIEDNFPEKSDNRIAGSNSVRETGNQSRTSGQRSPKFPGDYRVAVGENTGESTFNSESTGIETGYSNEKSTSKTMTSDKDSLQMLENQNHTKGWSGKSLEGSAVKEPDPLDMSEEAKAERWFRRVAQIKDISELSQIPDEDFPSIMPMRKGVNRFVVSKRKTPLERRLTSPQYRRNLPTVNSDAIKKENENG